MVFEVEEEEIKRGNSFWDYLKNPMSLVIIIAIIVLVVFHGRLGNFTLDKTLIYCGAVIIGVLLLEGFNTGLKNSTPKFIYGDGHTTTMGGWGSAGNFAVIRKGEIHAGSFYYPMGRGGGSGSVVVPVDSLTKVHKNLVSTSRTELASFEELPISARTYIRNYGLNPPYELGFGDDEQLATSMEINDEDLKAQLGATKLKKFNVSMLVAELKQTYRYCSFLESIIRKRGGMTEEDVSHANLLLQKARRDSFGKMLANKLTKDESEG